MLTEYTAEAFSYTYDDEFDILRVHNKTEADQPFSYEDMGKGMLLMIDDEKYMTCGAQVINFMRNKDTEERIAALTDFPVLQRTLKSIYGVTKKKKAVEGKLDEVGSIDEELIDYQPTPESINSMKGEGKYNT